ncbi:HET-domain-containing protein [Bimuria novae-zelandiae CBS 107.79]|uniref:HET-domain-containing protein n=1 Tax=Bimuria novae-zelandiae CBS 107.79 TaxID=1447943 RepID=A0A6A5V0E5_9PLEO|nr:HET-domain-containing protein [Bimuria novae-zelandiae CBS 107.79]
MTRRIWEWPYRLGHTFSGNLYQYIYAPFQPPINLRLLELRPGHRSSPIECELFNTSLEETPSYEALSYHWGNVNDTTEIVCNGRDFPITSNLRAALLDLRQPDRKRALWIDALCINQRDYSERNQQLQLMHQIYRRANKVLIWTGENTETVALVQSLFEQLRTLRARFGDLVYFNPSSLSSLGLPPESSNTWSALRYFFRRAWFQRAWVIQEAANASTLAVKSGSIDLEWEDMVFTARCVAESPMFAATDTASICRHLSFIDDCRLAQRNPSKGQFSLLNLLHQSRQCGATDLRDKIYGLYPLVDDQATLPKPDYEKSIQTVYKETAAHLITSTGKLDVLSFAGAARHPLTRSLKLPSWVPDWHAYDKAIPMIGSAQLIAETGPNQAPTDIQFSNDLDHLVLEGAVIDSIASVSDTIIPFQGNLTSKRETVDPLIRQWPEAKTTLEPTGEIIRILEVFHLPQSAFTTAWLMSERNQLTRLVYGRRLLRSASGALGLGPAHATANDKIAVFKRGSVPYVVRPDDGLYKLVGECFFPDVSRYQGSMHDLILK